MRALEWLILGTSIAICRQSHHWCAEGQEGCSGGEGWPTQGRETPTHCHRPIPPVLQLEGLRCAHLTDKRDFCRKTGHPEPIRSALLPAGLAGPGSLTTATKGQSSVCEASLTPAGLLLGEAELLKHILVIVSLPI